MNSLEKGAPVSRVTPGPRVPRQTEHWHARLPARRSRLFWAAQSGATRRVGELTPYRAGHQPIPVSPGVDGPQSSGRARQAAPDDVRNARVPYFVQGCGVSTVWVPPSSVPSYDVVWSATCRGLPLAARAAAVGDGNLLLLLRDVLQRIFVLNAMTAAMTPGAGISTAGVGPRISHL